MSPPHKTLEDRRSEKPFDTGDCCDNAQGLIFHDPLTTTSTEKIFLQDFLLLFILKKSILKFTLFVFI